MGLITYIRTKKIQEFMDRLEWYDKADPKIRDKFIASQFKLNKMQYNKVNKLLIRAGINTFKSGTKAIGYKICSMNNPDSFKRLILVDTIPDLGANVLSSIIDEESMKEEKDVNTSKEGT